MASESKDTKPTEPAVMTVESAIEHAKRAFALKKYEQAVEHYATALELVTKDKGDDAPETADLYFAYGKALLENAIAQSTVLGKEQPEDGDEAEAPGPSVNGGGPILSFSGDVEEYEGDEGTVDLATIEDAEPDEEENEAEPEDDFNAAWEVLDLARAIYERENEREEDEEVRLKLADTYIALGDVSLETEKFDVAITDYEAGLELKTDLLPISSRQIAEAHYKLSMVLDLTPGRLADAIMHAEKALESVNARLVELRNGLDKQSPGRSEKKGGGVKKEEKGDGEADVKQEEKVEDSDAGRKDGEKIAEMKKEENGEEEKGGKEKEFEVKKDVKGKGKASATRLVRDDLVKDMTRGQIEAEIKELDGLREDLALKVEELKTTPNEAPPSAPALAAQELERELNAGITGAKVPLPVNDLTSMVVKKKKKKDAKTEDGGAKRKAGDERAVSPPEKKAKLEATEA